MKQILMPKLGLTMEQGTIINWFIKPGDSFKEGDVIAEVETDKVTSDVTALFSGKLTQIIAEVDEEVQVGSPIAEAEEE